MCKSTSIFHPVVVSEETKLINFLHAYVQTFVTIYGSEIPLHVLDTPYLENKELIAVPNLPAMNFNSSLSILNGMLKVFGPYELTLLKSVNKNEPTANGLILSKFVQNRMLDYGFIGTHTPVAQDTTAEIYRPKVIPVFTAQTIHTFFFESYCNIH